jgi:hypothetical protein
MDKLISTLILTSVAVALAVGLMAYYPSFVKLFMNYEQLSFDYAYASVKDGQAEIVIRFRNTGEGKLTIVALEINGVEMEPKGTNPFPLELPSGSQARLRLHAGLDTFRNGVTYEVAIRTTSGGRYTKAVVIP